MKLFKKLFLLIIITTLFYSYSRKDNSNLLHKPKSQSICLFKSNSNLNLDTSDFNLGLILSSAAISRTVQTVIYNGNYFALDYPNGDVPKPFGVCTDVVIRSYRLAFGIDLQKEIHEDMKAHFNKYPANNLWSQTSTDYNIDHRRTQNQECFLKRRGAQVDITNNPNDYLPGDLIYWGEIASGHVGIIVNKYTNDSIPMVVHNIGYGTVCEDFLFNNKITGHYRWLPK